MISALRSCVSFSARVRLPSSSSRPEVICAISSRIAAIRPVMAASVFSLSASCCCSEAICFSLSAAASFLCSLSPVSAPSRAESWDTAFSVVRRSASREERALRCSAWSASALSS